MVGSQIVGVVVARHVLWLAPVATASREDLVAALAPAITHYLQGRWNVGSPEAIGVTPPA